MASTTNKIKLQSFIAGFRWKPAPKPVIETVETLGRQMSPYNNHEIWRTCNSCAEQFDVKKEGKFICPKCGSTDLRSGKYDD